MARPASLATVAVLAALVDGPGTTADLAQRLGMDRLAVMWALHNLCARGEVVKAELVRVRGVKRPVPVYARADPDEDDIGGDGRACGGVHDLIAVWAGLAPAGVAWRA